MNDLPLDVGEAFGKPTPQIIEGIRDVCRYTFHGHPVWNLVARVVRTSHIEAKEICRRARLDPDQIVTTEPLVPITPNLIATINEAKNLNCQFCGAPATPSKPTAPHTIVFDCGSVKSDFSHHRDSCSMGRSHLCFTRELDSLRSRLAKLERRDS